MEFNHTEHTLLDVIEYRSQHQPNKIGFIYLEDDNQSECHLTYGELNQAAKGIASALQPKASAGDRALLLFPPGLDFIKALFGCFYAKLIAVPAYPPRNNRNAQRIQAIAENAKSRLCLTTSCIKPRLMAMAKSLPEIDKNAWNFIDQIDPSTGNHWKKQSIKSNELAILQYTSGSTNLPKGVMVSHGNFVHNLTFSYKLWELSENSKFVSWLPAFHDMGLVAGILLPIFGGFPGILMSPTAFLQRPFRWLYAISRYEATISIAPNFGYDLCIEKISVRERKRLDLSCWIHAINGAEPVNLNTLNRFGEAFESCGFNPRAFNPGYGLAEATLVVSAGSKETQYAKITVNRDELGRNRVKEAQNEEINTHTFVGCGQGPPEQKILIVNPKTQKQCLPNQVGEVWIAGPSVAQGYWKRERETNAIFQACLFEAGDGPFLRTGDLGFMNKGELYITGRLKDLIIIHGTNYYPQDIELAVAQCNSFLRMGFGAAFSAVVRDSERLIVVQEIERRAKFDLDTLVDSVRKTIAENFGIQLYALLLIKSHTIPKTTSGKIQRNACKAAYESNRLNIIAKWQAEILSENSLNICQGSRLTSKDSVIPCDFDRQDGLKSWLISHLSRALNITMDKFDPFKPLASYGLDSVSSVALVGDLEKKIGCSLPASLIFDYPTVDSLYGYLIDETLENPKKGKDMGKSIPSEPIAIIGMACRFPQSNSIDEFWELLKNGVDAIREVPPTRWDKDGVDYLNQNNDRCILKWGGFVQAADAFDSNFFEISTREAKSMDPQQRMLLETVWEAIENAAQGPNRFNGSQTGVFIGISSFDHALLEFNDPDAIDAYGGTGIAHSIAANRVSYFLNLLGPSLTVDTACSSSLVAVHLACQSLQKGESNMAVAGGVNVILAPLLTQSFLQAGMLAKDGRCKTFDKRADGYVRGEGCGIIILKRESEAIEDNDQILALINGSAINQDGRSNGLTAPNGPSQELVIRKALDQARVRPSQISYVECHGTGTALGDPQEVRALDNVLRAGRVKSQQCVIGSVKTNIGHLEAAAGIAGLIKVILSLNHELIPANIHFGEINPHIPLDSTYFAILTTPMDWPKTDKPRFAGVSSFGFGGSNSHVVISEAPSLQIKRPALERSRHVLTLSAKDKQSLKQLASQYVNILPLFSETSLPDMCFTANNGRTHFNYRAAIAVESWEQAADKLETITSGEIDPDVYMGKTSPDSSLKLVFMFTGQGGQYEGMARGLYETQPVFRQSLTRCATILDSHLDRSLLSIIYPDSGEQSSLINEMNYAQLALFALEYSIVEMLKSWGVNADAVIGHSIGEYVAACVAGVFTLEEGLTLIAERGDSLCSLTKTGKMASIFADSIMVSEKIKDFSGAVSIAAINSPLNTVISGENSAVDKILEQLRKEKIAYRDLKVSHAFHSKLMDPILDEFEIIAGKIRYNTPKIPIISNLTGEWVRDNVAMNATHWKEHIRKPVQFFKGIVTCLESGYTTFIEVGSMPTLVKLVKNCLPVTKISVNDIVLLNTIDKKKDAWETLLDSIARLYTKGYPIDWDGFDRGFARRRVALPTYPFNQKAFPIRRSISTSRKSGNRKIFDILVTVGRKQSIEGINLFELDKFYELSHKLNQVSLGYQCRALSHLAKLHQLGSKISVDLLIKKAHILPRHRKLLQRWMENLHKNNILDQKNNAFVPRDLFVFASEEMSSVESIRQQVQGQDISVFVDYVTLFGDNLPGLLTGEVDPLALLFPSGSFEMAKRMYHHSSIARYYNGIITKIVETIVKDSYKNTNNSIKILEIGAGTGGTTSSVLPVCSPGRTMYHFTDISDLFIGRAQKQFSEFEHVKYSFLNIEDDPIGQGIEPSEYTLVIAANSLHATRNLSQTLGHISTILAPGGILILWELTHQQIWFDSTFGLIDGWQRFEDKEMRPDHPLLSGKEWMRLLNDHNFINVARFPESELMNFDLGQQIIVAQRDAVALGPERIGSIPLDSTGSDSNSQKAQSIGVDKFLYEIQWIEKDISKKTEKAAEKSRLWIVFADQSGVADRLVQIFEREGQQFICLRLSEKPNKKRINEVYLNPDNPEGIEELLVKIGNKEADRILSIVHCCSLDYGNPKETDLNSIEALLKYGCEHVINTVRSILGYRDLFSMIKFWIVTRGSQYVKDHPGKIASASATLWGLGRVIAVEYPELWGGLVDLDHKISENETILLVNEFRNSDPEDQIAYREDKRFVARLTEQHSPHGSMNNDGLTCRPDATYLITGGLGGMGLMTARWLAGRGARRLLLLGRNDLPPRRKWKEIPEGTSLLQKIKEIRDLESQGISVMTAGFDLGDPNAFKSFFSVFNDEDWPPIRGVVHAAGTLQDSSLEYLTSEAFTRVVRPKVIGGWLLHTLLQERYPLDFFIMYSSAASILASSGGGNYAAANAFLDSLTFQRSMLGLPSLSINWGPVEGIGLAAEGNRSERLAIRGIQAIKPEECLLAMEQFLLGNVPQCVIISIIWSQFLQSYATESVPKLLFGMRAKYKTEDESNENDEGDRPSKTAEDSPSDSSQNKRSLEDVKTFIVEQVSELLMESPSQLDHDLPFQKQGLDSIMAVQLANELELHFDFKIPMNELVQASINDLANQVFKSLEES